MEGQTAWTLVVSYIVTAEDISAGVYAEESTAAVEQVVEQMVTEGMSDYDNASLPDNFE